MATALPKTKTISFKGAALQAQQLKDNTGAAINMTELTALSTELALLDGVTASATELNYNDTTTIGVAQASKAVILDSNKDVASLRNLTAVNYDAGADAVAGTVDIFPTTTASGKITIQAADSAGAFNLTVTNASLAASRTVTIPDPGASASFVMTAGTQTIAGAKTFSSAPDAPVAGYKADGVTLTQMKWVDVAVTAALLDAAGTVNVIAGVSGDQYKIRHIRLVGGGTSFGAGGDRLISLTDGTTVWTTIANADIESAPSATLDWGNAKVPFLTSTSNTSSASNAAIRFQYSGGSADHTTGSITFSVCIEKVA